MDHSHIFALLKRDKHLQSIFESIRTIGRFFVGISELGINKNEWYSKTGNGFTWCYGIKIKEKVIGSVCFGFRLKNGEHLSTDMTNNTLLLPDGIIEADLSYIYQWIPVLRLVGERLDLLADELVLELDNSGYHIEAAENFIDTYFMKEIRLEDVANHIHLSQAYTSRLFKEETGFNFTEYLADKRLFEAKKLLKDTRLSVGQIAFETGFNSISNFNRVFKKLVGLTPTAFRQKFV